MAKKNGTFSFKDITGLTQNVIKKMPVQHETETDVNTRNTIGTGIYVLNAAISTDIYGGVPDNRISVFAAPSGCLFPTEKVNIYNMKTLSKKHNVYIVENDEQTDRN